MNCLGVESHSTTYTQINRVRAELQLSVILPGGDNATAVVASSEGSPKGFEGAVTEGFQRLEEQLNDAQVAYMVASGR